MGSEGWRRCRWRESRHHFPISARRTPWDSVVGHRAVTAVSSGGGPGPWPLKTAKDGQQQTAVQRQVEALLEDLWSNAGTAWGVVVRQRRSRQPPMPVAHGYFDTEQPLLRKLGASARVIRRNRAVTTRPPRPLPRSRRLQPELSTPRRHLALIAQTSERRAARLLAQETRITVLHQPVFCVPDSRS